MYQARTYYQALLLLLIVPALAACPDDLTGPANTDGTSTPTSGQSSTSAADTTGAADSTGPGDETGPSDSTSGGDPPEPPPAATINCSQVHAPLANMNVAERSVSASPAPLCDDLQYAWEEDFPIWIWEPEDPNTNERVTDGRPWILLQHGTGQYPTEYQHLVDDFVQNGFVVFAPDGEDDIGADQRLHEVLCALRWIEQEYATPEPGGELGECFAMVGHSSGGEAAATAAWSLARNHNPLADRIAALVTIAPSEINDLSFVAERAPPTLVLVGTHDHDTTQNGLRMYEAMANEGMLDRSTDRPGSTPEWVGEKVLVEAFDVSHSAFGGKSDIWEDPRAFLNPTEMKAKGHAIAQAYVPAFVYWQMFDDETYRPRFVDNEHPPGFALNTSTWWSDLSQWSSVSQTPLIHTSYQTGNRRGVGNRRLVVDTFEEADLANPYPGAAGGVRAPDETGGVSFSTGLDVALVMPDSLGASNRNNALLVDWNAGDTGSMRWDNFGPLNFTPDYLSLRVQNVFDGWSSGFPNCVADGSEEELSLELRLHSLDDSTTPPTEGVVSTRFENIIIQDHSNTGWNNACDNVHSLYTLRVPISCMDLDSGSFNPADIDMIDIQFGDANTDGRLLLDSVELTYSTEEPSNPDCSHLTASSGSLAPSFICHGYDPANQVSFTPNSGGPTGPIGDVTFGGAFGKLVASRPYVLTECDNARYELASISVDKDSDGTADESHDVREFDLVDRTDLVALLGLENGDAAITINEPGKPAENAVELYDWSSFLAAQRRFGALQDLEVRFLREQASGEHRPELLLADVPAELTGVAAPESPTPPSTYTLPSGATYVTNASDLIDELALPGGHDIIVADGTYAWAGPVTVAGPHRIWSETLHGATLSFGLTYAGNADRTGGMELHGLDFALDDASMAPFGVGTSHVLFMWGQGGEDVLIEDCAFDGDLTIGDAVGSFAPNGLVVRRSTISNFWSQGVLAKQGATGTVLTSEPLLEDITIQSIFDTVPGSSSGARENGILLGNNASIARVDIRDVGWSAIQLFNDATGVSIEDAVIDYAGPTVWDPSYTNARGAGIWLAQSHDVVINRVRVESHTFLGINAHWDMGSPDPFSNTTPPRNHNIEISNLYSRAFKIGVHLDLGVEDTVIRNARFEHAWMAGVLDNNRFEDDWGTHTCPGGEPVCLASTNSTTAIDCYLQDGVDCIAHHHNGGATTAPPTGWVTHPDAYTQPGGLLNRNNAALPGPGSGTSGSDGSETGQWGSSSN